MLLAACGGNAPSPASSTPRGALPGNWRSVATAADRTRLRNWRETWLAAAARARSGGGAAALAADAPLFDLDRFLVDPVPPPGDYRCRVVKLGAQGVGTREFFSEPPYACRIDREGDLTSFAKIAGPQRPVGLIFPDPQGRAVFLGTLLLGDETRAINYGRDTARDLAGYVDRIGERRWRMVLPSPAFESMLDVVEIVPVS
ncbi:DUF4893 domain-containing protein [Sphingomonas sp. NBWT7]|nr:DUF4893 domain-containing protein [Sphingomonas sp. NBWT7]